MEEQHKLMPFEGREIRKLWHQDEWWFSVVDVIEILTNSVTPRKYWNTLKTREPQLSSICGQLKMPSADGKKYKTDAANTEGGASDCHVCPFAQSRAVKIVVGTSGQRTH